MLKLIIIVISYLLGSIPTAYIIAKILKSIDIREVGSGNMGATNVWRNVGKSAAIITLIIDILKGYAAVKIAMVFLPNNVLLHIITGIICILGHSFPVFLKFKGGKGMATALGVFMVLTPQVVLIEILIFAVSVYLFGYISLASIIAAALFPMLTYVTGYDIYIISFTTIIAVFVIIRHKANIKRLINGTEMKFSK